MGPSGGCCFSHGLLLILESSSSADFGRPSGFRLAASAYANKQWAHMRQLAVPAVLQVKEEDVDRRPKWETARPTMKEWSSSITSMKRKASVLTEADESALFRASQFPSSLLHVEADLKGKKPFRDATLRTNVAGACGLAFVRCGELAFSLLGKDSTFMCRLHDAISGDSPQDVYSLLQVIKDTREDLIDIRKGLGKVANVGSNIAAGSFNQGVEEIRHLVWESPSAKAVRPTLELCPPSPFGNEVHIREALEADRRRPYQAGSFRSKPSFNPRSSNSQEGWARRKKSNKKPYNSKKSSYRRPAGKANGPASKKGEGQKKQ
jgi:hypothetical protein